MNAEQLIRTIRGSSDISYNGLSTVNVLLTIKPKFLFSEEFRCFVLSCLPKFGLEAPSLLCVGRANRVPRCLLWICAFVLLIRIHTRFDVPLIASVMCNLFCPQTLGMRHDFQTNTEVFSLFSYNSNHTGLK